MPSFINKLQTLCSRIANSSKRSYKKGLSSRRSTESFDEISEADLPSQGLYASSSCESTFYEVSYSDLGSKYIPEPSDSVSCTETTLSCPNSPSILPEDMSDTLCEIPTNLSHDFIANVIELESISSVNSIYMKFPLPPVEIPVKPIVYNLPPTKPLNIVKKSKANTVVPIPVCLSSPTEVVLAPIKPLNIIKRAKKANTVNVIVQQQSADCNIEWSKVESADARFPAVPTVTVAAMKKACADSRRSRRDSLDFILHDLDADLAYATRLDTFIGYKRMAPRSLRPTCSPHSTNPPA